MKRSTTAVAIAAVALGAGTAGVAAATGEQGEAPRAQFQDNLAKRLGVSDSELKKASQSAAKDTIDQLEKAGKIDAARADRLRKRVGHGASAPFTQLGTPQKKAPARRAGVEALGRQIGVNPKVLTQALRKGAVPADLIAKAGKDRETVKAAVRDAARKALDPAVKKGLDAKKADARAAKIADRLTGTEPVGKKKTQKG